MIRKTAWMTPLLVLALLMQTLLPFYAVYNFSPRTTAQEFAAIYGETVIICTRDGFKRVGWEEAVKHESPEHPQYECGVCYLTAHGQAIGTGGCAATATPLHAHSTVVAAVIALPELSGIGRTGLTRAPPASIVTA